MTPLSCTSPCRSPGGSLALSAYVDGELGPDQTIDIDAHVRGCGVCGERVRLLRATRESLRRAGAARCPRALRQRVERTLSFERARRALCAARGWPLRCALALAAAATVALTLRAERAPAAVSATRSRPISTRTRARASSSRWRHRRRRSHPARA